MAFERVVKRAANLVENSAVKWAVHLAASSAVKRVAWKADQSERSLFACRLAAAKTPQ